MAHRLPGKWDRRARELGKLLVNYRGARGTGHRAVRFATLRRRSPLVAAPFGPGQLLVDTADEEIGRTVFITGGYERTYMAAAVEYLNTHHIPIAGKTFVDIGANIGTSTVDALLEFGFSKALCFEPEASNARLLRMNLVLNDLEDRADPHQVALSDHDGRLLIQRSATNSGDHRTLREEDLARTNGHGNGRGRGPGDGGLQQVDAVRFDSFVERGEVDMEDVGLLWIDAQGHEAAVLSGATTALRRGVPVVLEYWPEALGSSLDLLEELISANYGTVVDLRVLAEGIADEAVLDAAEVAGLRRQYKGQALTDLLLLK